MKIFQIGESGIIEIFRRNFDTLPHILLGVSSDLGVYNDAGVIQLEDNNLLIVTTDMIGLKTHLPDIATPEQVGKKSVTVNISDLAAMGARPLGLVMSIGIPLELDTNYLERVAKGMNESARNYSTCIFGGDVNRADDLIMAGTAIGITTKDKLYTRNNAQIGDILCVTGYLGNAAAAYYAWKKKIELSPNIRDELYPYLLEPTARIRESLLLKDLMAVSSCGDITDGLGWELYKTGQASQVGFRLEERLVPVKNMVIQVAEKLKKDSLDLILYHGEDFELILTIKKAKWNDTFRKMKKLGVNLIKIGEVCDKKYGNVIIRKDGSEIKIKNIGYDQFKNELI